MTLKEAFRYQNFLDTLIRKANEYLLNKNFLTVTTQSHAKKKVYPNAEDEVVEVKSKLEFVPNNVIDFLCKALSEKDKLYYAICNAKKSTEIDIDSSVTMNKMKQSYIDVLKYMSGLKDTETVSRGTGYKFNEDGDQVSYYYDITSVTKIDFNRNDVRALIKKYQKECDEVSNKLDIIMLTTNVDYVPIWDLTDTFEEIVTTNK